MKPDRMAAYEAPRDHSPLRPMVEIELKSKGYRRDIKGTRVKVLVPKTNPMPEVVTYEGRIFVCKDGGYAEATIWPIIKELDGC